MRLARIVAVLVTALLGAGAASATSCLYAAHPFLDAVSVVDLDRGAPVGSIGLFYPYRAAIRPSTADVYIANRELGSGTYQLTRIDAATAQAVDAVPVAVGEPSALRFTRDGTLALLPFWAGAARLALFNPETVEMEPLLPRVDDGAVAVAFDVAASGDGRTAYVTLPPDNVVQIVDLVAGAVVGTIPFPDTYRARHIVLSPDEATAYVSAPPTSPGVPNSVTPGPGRIAVIDTATRTLTRWIELPQAPEQIVLTADGAAALVTYPNGGGAGIVDTAGPRIAFVPLAGFAIDVATGSDPARAYVSVTALGGRTTLAVIDVASAQMVDTIAIQDLADGLALAEVAGDCGVPPAPCAGDCDGDGTVDVSEILTAVRASLDHYQLKRCRAADSDWDGDVTIAELMRGVHGALDGCDRP